MSPTEIRCMALLAAAMSMTQLGAAKRALDERGDVTQLVIERAKIFEAFLHNGGYPTLDELLKPESKHD
jgi:hypothetical protein